MYLFFIGGESTLPVEGVWDYIMTNISPLFKGLVCTSFLAMAMSTADSYLNACSVIVSNDMVKILQKREKITDVYQFKIARWTTLLVGLSSMF